MINIKQRNIAANKQKEEKRQKKQKKQAFRRAQITEDFEDRSSAIKLFNSAESSSSFDKSCYNCDEFDYIKKNCSHQQKFFRIATRSLATRIQEASIESSESEKSRECSKNDASSTVTRREEM